MCPLMIVSPPTERVPDTSRFEVRVSPANDAFPPTERVPDTLRDSTTSRFEVCVSPANDAFPPTERVPSMTESPSMFVAPDTDKSPPNFASVSTSRKRIVTDGITH